jgi:hypothetical protein
MKAEDRFAAHTLIVEDDDGTQYSLEFVGHGHATLIQREGVRKRQAVHTTILDDPCPCLDEHVELWAVRQESEL